MQNNDEAFWNLEMGDGKSAHLPFPDSRMPSSHKLLYTILQNKRMRLHPPTNNFQKTYKVTPTTYISSEREFIGESESSKYWENILISRFYEQFSRSSQNLGHFLEVLKNCKLLEHRHIIYHFEAGDLEIPNI